MITINIPSALKIYCDNQSEVPIEAKTVEHALSELVQKFPALKKHLFGQDGQLRSFVNIFLEDEDIRYLDGIQTQITTQRELNIIPSIAGGIHVTQ